MVEAVDLKPAPVGGHSAPSLNVTSMMMLCRDSLANNSRRHGARKRPQKLSRENGPSKKNYRYHAKGDSFSFENKRRAPANQSCSILPSEQRFLIFCRVGAVRRLVEPQARRYKRIRPLRHWPRPSRVTVLGFQPSPLVSTSLRLANAF